MRLLLCLVLVSFLRFAGNVANAQSPAKQPIRRDGDKNLSTPTAKSVNLSIVDPIIGLPDSTVMGYPQTCSTDGVLFLQIYAALENNEVSSFPDIYTVSEQREVKHLNGPSIADFKQLSLRSLYPSENNVAYLIQATQPRDPKESLMPGRLASYIAVTDHTGNGQRTLRLELNFEPVKVAISDSGTLLVLGMDTVNLRPVLVSLKDDGSIEKTLDIDHRTYASSKELKQSYPEKPKDTNTTAEARVILNSLNKAQFVPWGHDILLVQPGSSLPVYTISPTLSISPISITAPSGYLLKTILGSGEGDSWVAVFSAESEFQKVASGQVSENAADKLFEINKSV